MTHKQKGITVRFIEWWRHLRPDYKRIFWKKQRQAFKKELREHQP